MKKHIEQSFQTIQTTIGELVEALMLVAEEDGSSEVESYELTAQALGTILSKQDFDTTLLNS